MAAASTEMREANPQKMFKKPNEPLKVWTHEANF